MLSVWNLRLEFDNEQSRKILGIEYSRDLSETLNDFVESMIKTGVVPKRRVPGNNPWGCHVKKAPK